MLLVVYMYIFYLNRIKPMSRGILLYIRILKFYIQLPLVSSQNCIINETF